MDDAFALLSLQVEWGADEALEDAPLDRLRPLESPAPAIGMPLQGMPPQGMPQGSLTGGTAGLTAGLSGAPAAGAVSGGNRPRYPAVASGAAAPAGIAASGTPAERALAAASAATTLDELRAAIAGFDGCALRDTASHMVFAEGDPASVVMVIGEPPGRDEDRSGRPFAGAEGELLDHMFVSIGLTRADLMLAPLLPWRPPGGRPPSPAEMAICQPFLNRLISLINPDRLVAFGGTATRMLLPKGTARRRGRPEWVEISIAGMQKKLPLLTLPSLAEMLKNPPLRRDAWAGLRLLRRTLDDAPTRL